MIRSPPSRAEQTEQERQLLVRRDVVELLVDRVGRELLAVDDDFGRVGHLAPAELHHPPRQGGGEHQRLALVGVGQAVEQPPEVFGEAHVEEAVALVDHDHLGVAQRVGALAVIVDESAGGADEQIDPAGEPFSLFLVVDPAEDHVHAERDVGRELFGVRRDLDGELAGRGDDQGAGILDLRSPLLPHHLAEDGQQVGRGLARTGLRLGDDVASLEGQRQHLLLDSGQAFEAEIIDRREEFLGEIDIVKMKDRKKADRWPSRQSWRASVAPKFSGAGTVVGSGARRICRLFRRSIPGTLVGAPGKNREAKSLEYDVWRA